MRMFRRFWSNDKWRLSYEAYEGFYAKSEHNTSLASKSMQSSPLVWQDLLRNESLCLARQCSKVTDPSRSLWTPPPAYLHVSEKCHPCVSDGTPPGSMALSKPQTDSCNNVHFLLKIAIKYHSFIHFWHAPLGVHGTKCRHQSPDWTILSHVNCFLQAEVIGFQVLQEWLDSLHPRSTRASWWSPTVLMYTEKITDSNVQTKERWEKFVLIFNNICQPIKCDV